jgi:hypothetical protein
MPRWLRWASPLAPKEAHGLRTDSSSYSYELKRYCAELSRRLSETTPAALAAGP